MHIDDLCVLTLAFFFSTLSYFFISLFFFLTLSSCARCPFRGASLSLPRVFFFFCSDSSDQLTSFAIIEHYSLDTGAVQTYICASSLRFFLVSAFTLCIIRMSARPYTTSNAHRFFIDSHQIRQQNAIVITVLLSLTCVCTLPTYSSVF